MSQETLERTVEVDGETYTVTLEPEDGGFVASVKNLPGCLTEGNDVDETLENVKDAIRAWNEASDGVAQ